MLTIPKAVYRTCKKNIFACVKMEKGEKDTSPDERTFSAYRVRDTAQHVFKVITLIVFNIPNLLCS